MIDFSELIAGPPEAWARAFAIAVVVSITTWLAVEFGRRASRFLSGKTPFAADDLLPVVLARTRWLFPVAVGIWSAQELVTGLPKLAADTLNHGAGLLVIVQLAIWGRSAVDWQVNRIRRERLKSDAETATSIGAVGILAKTALYVLLVLLALENFGFEVTALIAGLGVAGVAVALAVQSILGDLFASLSIILDRPFIIGDYLQVGELQGTVERIGLKSTRVRSLSGEQLVFSNTDLLSSRIKNFRRMDERRVAFSLGLTYQTPHEELCRVPEIVRRIVEDTPRARFGRAHLKTLGDWALEFEVVYFVDDRSYDLYMEVQEAINLEILRRFEAEGLELAFPTQTLLVEPTPPPDSDR